MSNKEECFNKEMIGIYYSAKREVNYTPTYFFNMLDQYGGLGTARKLINSPKVSEGCIKLYEKGRLDLTVEAVIFDNEQWHDLFTDEELEKVKKRLVEYEYPPALTASFSQDIQSDIEGISHDTKLNETEKKYLINARLGQGKYRQDLIGHWGCCSVTRYDDISMLVASHIKPWSKSSNEERLDKFNGLLLIPNIDKAFDKGLISFDNNGKILISTSLKSFEKLGIGKDMRIELDDKHKTYMSYHRENKLNYSQTILK